MLPDDQGYKTKSKDHKYWNIDEGEGVFCEELHCILEEKALIF